MKRRPTVELHLKDIEMNPYLSKTMNFSFYKYLLNILYFLLFMASCEKESVKVTNLIEKGNLFVRFIGDSSILKKDYGIKYLPGKSSVFVEVTLNVSSGDEPFFRKKIQFEINSPVYGSKNLFGREEIQNLRNLERVIYENNVNFMSLDDDEQAILLKILDERISFDTIWILNQIFFPYTKIIHINKKLCAHSRFNNSVDLKTYEQEKVDLFNMMPGEPTDTKLIFDFVEYGEPEISINSKGTTCSYSLSAKFNQGEKIVDYTVLIKYVVKFTEGFISEIEYWKDNKIISTIEISKSM